MRIGVQSMNVIRDENPAEGFQKLREAGFSCCDFGLNEYLTNTTIYKAVDVSELHSFYDKSEKELDDFFTPHREAAQRAGITINQMHMPYPNFVPGASDAVNTYLREVIALRSLHVCVFFKCRYIVIHGFKLNRYLGSEDAEWSKTQEFLDYLAPYAKTYGVTMCVENIYVSAGPQHIIEGPCCNARKAAARIDAMNERYGAEVLGFCFDTGHANLVGLDFYDFITTLGKRLKVLHIHDNDGISDLHQIPFTFTRERNNRPVTDWEGFLAGLAAIDFDGVLNFETAPCLKSFPQELHGTALRTIAEIGRYFEARLLERKI